MKQTRLVKMLAVAFGMTLGTAVAQQTTTFDSNTVSDTGTITAYAPGSDYIAFQADMDKTPERFYLTKNTTILDPGGRVVTWSALGPNLPAIVYHEREGNRLVVRKILLRRPGTVYERKTTTSTDEP
jgi:hypothetical protein